MSNQEKKGADDASSDEEHAGASSFAVVSRNKGKRGDKRRDSQVRRNEDESESRMDVDAPAAAAGAPKQPTFICLIDFADKVQQKSRFGTNERLMVALLEEHLPGFIASLKEATVMNKDGFKFVTSVDWVPKIRALEENGVLEGKAAVKYPSRGPDGRRPQDLLKVVVYGVPRGWAAKDFAQHLKMKVISLDRFANIPSMAALHMESLEDAQSLIAEGSWHYLGKVILFQKPDSAEQKAKKKAVRAAKAAPPSSKARAQPPLLAAHPMENPAWPALNAAHPKQILAPASPSLGHLEEKLDRLTAVLEQLAALFGPMLSQNPALAASVYALLGSGGVPPAAAAAAPQPPVAAQPASQPAAAASSAPSPPAAASSAPPPPAAASSALHPPAAAPQASLPAASASSHRNVRTSPSAAFSAPLSPRSPTHQGQARLALAEKASPNLRRALRDDSVPVKVYVRGLKGIFKYWALKHFQGDPFEIDAVALERLGNTATTAYLHMKSAEAARELIAKSPLRWSHNDKVHELEFLELPAC